MDRTIRFLEDKGIITDEAADRFALKSSIDDVRKVVEEIRNLLNATTEEDAHLYEENPIDAFNFVPSRSLRSDTCRHWDCVKRKVEFLARYGALYGDHLIVPLHIPLPEAIEDSVFSRDPIASILKELLLLRQVMEAGIAHVVLPELHYCEEHAREARAQIKTFEQEAHDLYIAHRKKFSGSYSAMEGIQGVAGFASLEGPADYLEHGSYACIFRHAPPWAPPHRDRRPVRLTGKRLERSGLVQGVFKEIARDVVFHQLYGVRFDAKYLTDLPAEAEFMNRMSAGDEHVQRVASLAAQLTHTIPLFSEVSIPAILRVRKEGNEPLILYRAALAEIVRDHLAKGEQVTPGRAREIFCEVLEPRLLSLKAEVKAMRAKSAKKAVAKVGVPAALVCLGVWGGFLPAALSALFKAVGGVSMAANMVETLASMEKNPYELRSHNLYFLLRLTQEAG